VESRLDAHWQVQEAKQRFSELVRRAEADGAQFISRHGDVVVVVLDVAEYQRLTAHAPDFKEFLLGGPSADVPTLTRRDDGHRRIDLFEDV
jgi:prevent-host-death family protein